MQTGNFYFINDDFFDDFPDGNLMRNKESMDGVLRNRPCFYAFYDSSSSIYWLIPISSRLRKFKFIYDKNVARYGSCDTIVFGQVLGRDTAFLIQNMCPVIPQYIKNEYIDQKNLASKLLSLCAKQLPGDWEERYGYRPVLLETFVEQERFTGTCYKAANWIRVGQTTGRGKWEQKGDNKVRAPLAIKDIFVYPLQRDYEAVLKKEI